MKMASKITKRFTVAIVVISIGFFVGIYLQDVKHKESTTAAWEANRFNLKRFNQIMDYTNRMTPNNWVEMRDSILSQTDSLMILRFRKEMDSLNEFRNADANAWIKD